MNSHPTISIAGQTIGSESRPYVIAELSGNHNGNIGHALAIMDAAREAGADAIKLQTYTADTLTIDHDGPGFTISGGLWEGRTLYELYQQASTPWDWHEELFAHGRKIGITVFSSPFDETAIEFLETLQAPAYKIASFEMVDHALIERAAATGKPLIISTGLATFDEIDEAINAAQRGGAREIMLLHCISGYPTPAEDANLATIPVLRDRLCLPIGLSDHTLGTAVATAAVALGAVAIEKHVTLRRDDGGPDAAFSLEPDELKTLCDDCRTGWAALGTPKYERARSEEDSMIFRRSLYVVADIPAGGTLDTTNIRSIRPGYGLPPKHLKDVLGRRARNAIMRGTALDWSLIE